MFALKYMNKFACIKSGATDNVLRELDILREVDHPFLVNLWFTFHDCDTIYMVVDLLLGGDLRFHMQRGVPFKPKQVKLYICELALALDYLHSRNTIHRDLKLDNLLLDESGHVHLTDFNIATVVGKSKSSSSICGTRPYMAPEIFKISVDSTVTYSFEVDYWSLGILAYELLATKRPYNITGDMKMPDIYELITSRSVNYNYINDPIMVSIIKQLLTINPKNRLCSLNEIRNSPDFSEFNFDEVLSMDVQPDFVPRTDNLNCDPTYELEEMILEAEPLHKKRHSKKNSSMDGEDYTSKQLRSIANRFRPYNREQNDNATTTTTTTASTTGQRPPPSSSSPSTNNQ